MPIYALRPLGLGCSFALVPNIVLVQTAKSVPATHAVGDELGPRARRAAWRARRVLGNPRQQVHGGGRQPRNRHGGPELPQGPTRPGDLGMLTPKSLATAGGGGRLDVFGV